MSFQLLIFFLSFVLLQRDEKEKMRLASIKLEDENDAEDSFSDPGSDEEQVQPASVKAPVKVSKL
jgi:hypothetical protein